MNTRVTIERADIAELNGSHIKTMPSVWHVDDDGLYREQLMCLLKDELCVNYSRSFSSALSLLAALRQDSPPDVILMDVQMPEMSGIEAIRPVKHLAPSTVVLMLTTFYNHQHKQEALTAGAAGFLLKRNSQTQIIAAVRAASAQFSSLCNAHILSPQ